MKIRHLSDTDLGQYENRSALRKTDQKGLFMRKSHLKKVKLIILFCLFILCLSAILFLSLQMPEVQKEDFRQISSQKYDSVFLSMYPIDTYSEEIFLVNGGRTILKTSYCIPGFSVLQQYMEHISDSGNILHTIYLGIRPDKMPLKKLQKLIEQYPAIHFDIILSYPSAEYWKSLSSTEYARIIKAYCNFLTAAPSILNANFYFMGSQEWLISNPGNYKNDWLVNEDIARLITLLTVIDGEYPVTAESASLFSENMKELTEQIRSAPKIFPDLSDYRLVFFGDSVIDLYTDSSSVSGVVAGLTDAAVFNCGAGGGSAAVRKDFPIALPAIAESAIYGDLSLLPEDRQVYCGVSSYLASPPSDQKLCFIIYYGLNDYFNGLPILSETDPYDTSTYCGAIRTAVATIRSKIPDAQIILCAPNPICIFDRGTEIHGDGYVLEDYAKAILSLGDELQTDVLDTYHDFEINDDNWYEYLLKDQVHPNAAFRYMIGEKIIRLIR